MSGQGTSHDFLPKNTVAFEPGGKGKILVRYRKGNGQTFSRQCVTPEEANEYFWKWVADLKRATEDLRWYNQQGQG